MNFTVPVALFGWPLVAITLCATLPPRRAVIAAYVAAWLFLPVYSYSVPGLPDWTKVSATSVSLLLGLTIFDFHRMIQFRPRWIDFPMIAWCLSSVPSALLNGLGLYDGLSNSLDLVVVWGLPYFLGRLYFSDVDSLHDLAMGLFLGGVVYVPLCLFELRMSPQLHAIVYGFDPTRFEMNVRFGGWRPTVFMTHGLMVAMWMSMCSLVGIWLWVNGSLKPWRGYAPGWFVIPLVVTTVLCKSTGALVLLLAGLLLLWWVYRFRTRAPMVVLALVAPLYILVRITGIWSGDEFVDAANMVSAERAESLETRLNNEDSLADKALKRPFFGWGGWGRSRVSDETGRDISVTDGLWIIEFGVRGFVGLIAMLSVLLFPYVALCRRLPAWEWIRPYAGHVAALTAVVGFYLLDCLANAMVNPIYVLAAGGITGLMLHRGLIREPAGDEQESTASGS